MPSLRGDSQSAVPAADGLPLPRRNWAALAIWLAMAMTVLDTSIANIALPTMARELGASSVASIWIVNAYQIAIIITLLSLASVGEIVGYRQVYLGGLALFVAASVACTLAGSLAVLVMARFAQGLGAAAIMSVNGALVRFTFPSRHLGRAMGYNALVIAVSAASGPTVAGILLSCGSWRWIFAVNILFGVLSLLAGCRCLPHAKGEAGVFDLVSALLSAIALGGLFLGCSGGIQGAARWLIATGFGLFLVAGALVIRRAMGQSLPLVPLDLWRRPVLRLSYGASICSFAAQMAALVFLPFYLTSHFGFDHLRTGLLVTPIPLGIALSAPIAGQLSDRFPGGFLGGIGLCLAASGLAALAFLPLHISPVPAIVGCGLLCGVGFGLFQAPNNRTMIGKAPRERSGAAAGMLAISRLIGQATGALMVALLFHLVGTMNVTPLLAAAVFALVGATLSFRRVPGKETSPDNAAKAK